MRKPICILTTIFLLGAFSARHAKAAEAVPSNPYSGDLLSRSTLTGDWGGVRNQLAEKGITFDVNITQIGQGVVGGGKNGAWEYGGRGDTTISVDTGKLGLWPGGFFNFELEGNWASSVNPKTGALMPVNTNQVFPLPPGDIFGIPALNFTQFLSPYVGLLIGKLDTTSGDANEFAHGKGDTKFMNLAFNFNPTVLFTVPYSTLGTGVIVLPTKDPKEAIVNLSVMQTNGNPTTSGFEDLNGNKLTVAGEGRVRTNFFGLTGHQVFGASFSNQNFNSIDQRLVFFVRNSRLQLEKGSWAIHYNFDQYLYEPEKGVDRGIGIFSRLGVSDGNPNFIKFFGSFGVGGKGIIPGRPLDRFGLGYYYMNVHNPTLQGLVQTQKFLRNEYGFEAFYNAAITPWLLLTPDLQIIRGAQKDQASISPGLILPKIGRHSINTATVLGVRLQVLF